MHSPLGVRLHSHKFNCSHLSGDFVDGHHAAWFDVFTIQWFGVVRHQRDSHAGVVGYLQQEREPLGSWDNWRYIWTKYQVTINKKGEDLLPAKEAYKPLLSPDSLASSALTNIAAAFARKTSYQYFVIGLPPVICRRYPFFSHRRNKASFCLTKPFWKL